MNKEAYDIFIMSLRSLQSSEIKLLIDELEKTPLADVRGGKQRDSLENERLAILKGFLKGI